MSLPVSHYEALLAEVRGLRRKAQRVQLLATPLISSSHTSDDQEVPTTSAHHDNVEHIGTNFVLSGVLNNRMDPLVLDTHNLLGITDRDRYINGSTGGETTCSEDDCGGSHSTHLSVSSEPLTHPNRGVSSLYHGTWPVEGNMWNSEPVSSTEAQKQPSQMDVTSVMSFASSSGGAPLERALGGSPSRSMRSSNQLEAKVDMVYSLLAMLGGQEHADMGETLLALSTSPESCLAMRQSGCIPLLVQLVQSDKDCETRSKASQALQNLINAQPDEKIRKREVRIYKLLEQARSYTEALRNDTKYEPDSSCVSEDGDAHPVQTIAHLMKLSFDEGHRHTICQLGGIHVIANLIEVEHMKHGTAIDETHCILLRRYACMTLTNLTFGDSGNKALLCSYREFMRALVVQLQSSSDELRQVTASVLRNLSWRADGTSKDILREVGTVTGLMKAAMMDNKENTLKSILSALWNLSAHSTENKAEICAIEGALSFLVNMLSYRTASKSLAIVENSGGILRNISSQIAVRDDYREILRRHSCLHVLLDQLKSPSLTVVSNACGTLWNLSAKCAADQDLLWELGAPAMLRSLNHSKHKMIAMGSSAALKNLLSSRPKHSLMTSLDSTARAMDLPVLPTLGARRQKALMQDLDQNLSETFETIDRESPTKNTYIEAAFFEKVERHISSSKKPIKREKLLHSESFECVSHNDLSSYQSRTMRSDSCYQSLGPCEPSTSQSNNAKCKAASAAATTTLIPVRNQVSDEKKVICIENRLPRNVAKDYSSSKRRIENKRQETSCDSNVFQKHEADDGPFSFSGESSVSEEPNEHPIGNDAVLENGLLKMHLNLSDLDEKEPRSMEEVEQFKTVRCGRDDIVRRLQQVNLQDGKGCDGDTPLMFSPSSSVASLTSNEQDYIHNDRSSVASNFSHLSSISPSDLPDSPLQSAPNSPKIQKRTNKSHISKRSNMFYSKKEAKPASTTSIVADGEQTEKTYVYGSDLEKRDSEKGSKQSSIDNESNWHERDAHTTDEEVSVCVDPQMQKERHHLEDKQTFQTISDQQKNKEGDRWADVVNTTANLTAFGRDDNNKSEKDLGLTDLENNSAENKVVKTLAEEIQDDTEDTKIADLENRMLDPDAMIESLDRFTAELVSQACHLQNKEDKYSVSVTDGDTWNEDTSPNDVTFPSMSGSAPNVVTFKSESENHNKHEMISNDFSSSTLTESTLIAMEATKIATVFKREADMSQSATSLELDNVQPPSHLNSLTSSALDLGGVTKEPPIPRQKTPRLQKKLSAGLLVRRALSNSLNHTSSSTESLDNHNSLTNLEHVNPPSAMAELLDLEGSMTSVASLSSEVADRTFCKEPNPIFNVRQPATHETGSISGIENVNPPSLFAEVTDAYNSLCDIPTEVICDETEVFEDCYTHVMDADATLLTDGDFSDANNVTPLQSDACSSSAESTPKKNKQKHLTPKQKRNLARERYKTYTVAAEMVMREECQKMKEEMVKSNEEDVTTAADYNTAECSVETADELSSDISSANNSSSGKMTPRERRKSDRFRFQTQVINPTLTDPIATRQTSAKQNFLQKRIQNRDRFKTRTLDGDTRVNSEGNGDLHYFVEKEANLVLRTLKETKSHFEDLLECETLSLVSNEDESENNSGSSILNYRTYHKSWGLRTNAIPVICPQVEQPEEVAECDEEVKPAAKPKIVKPTEIKTETLPENDEEQPKGIRGRRKPLYGKTNSTSRGIPRSTKPIKNMTSELVKNVTSSLKQGANPKGKAQKSAPPTTKPPSGCGKTAGGGGPKQTAKTSSSISARSSPKHSTANLANARPKTSPALSKTPPLERQGTFTKADQPKTKIPTSQNPKTPPSKIAKPIVSKTTKNTVAKSASSGNSPGKWYNRSPSADSAAENAARRSPKNGAIKRPGVAHRSNSSSSIASTESTGAKKQITSKIASLWKKIEQNKKQQPPQNDTRVWIEATPKPTENKEETATTSPRRRGQSEGDAAKRISRLGSFVMVDEGEGGCASIRYNTIATSEVAI